MNITHILLNNAESGKISKEQRSWGWKVWQTDLKNLSFAEYAQISGGYGIRVHRAEELDLAFKKALDFNGPSVAEIMSDPELI